MKQETKHCQNCKTKFTIEPTDLKFYEKIQVPPPTFCPECRAQRRLAFRNERFLYRRKSDFSGEEMFSMYAPEAPVKVYENSVWFSDQWDPMEYGKDVDFSRPFLDQLRELLASVPVYTLSVQYGVNSDYSNNFTGFKNCYLCFNGNDTENSAYSNGINLSWDCFDCSYVDKSELYYEGFFLNACSRTFFPANCENSFSLSFSKNCIGCNDCFGCVNLRNKQYCIFNKQYSREEYHKKIKEFNLGSYADVQALYKKARVFWLQFPNKYMTGLKNTDVNGEYIYNSKNVQDSYQVKEGENIRYCHNLLVPKNKDCYDYSIWGENNELIYETAVSGIGNSNIKFCVECWPELRDSEYSLFCGSSSNLFGCVGLRKKHCCILNKQYSKEEYELLVPKIIEHMNDLPFKDKKGNIYRSGEFFPIEFSPIPYNHSLAQEFFPLTKEKIKEQGYFWKDTEEKNIIPAKKASELPDNIMDVNNSILQEIVSCLHEGECSHQCAKVFRIIPAEFAFYRSMNIAFPRLCPNCRYDERIAQRSPLTTWQRSCQCSGKSEKTHINTTEHFHKEKPCPNIFQTSYAPERNEIVYCEECYAVEVA